VAKREDFIAIAGALDENQRRMLRAIAPEATPMAPLMRLADSSPIAATVERDGKPVVVAGAVIDDPRAAGGGTAMQDDGLSPPSNGGHERPPRKASPRTPATQRAGRLSGARAL
jgi:hypothetical protein